MGVKDLKPTDPRLAQWGEVKGSLKKAVATNATLGAELTQLRQLEQTFKARETELQKQLEEAKAGVKTGEATPAEVAAVRSKLDDLQKKYDADTAELNEFRAARKLEENAAFKQQFDAPRAEAVRAAKETATQIGLEPEKLDAIFSGKTEYAIRKAITDLEIEDLVAEKLITEKALAYAKLTVEREATLAGQGGRKASEVLAEWEGYQAQLGGALTQKFTAELQGKALLAVEQVKTRLPEAHRFFKTEAGVELLGEIETRFRQGFDLPVEEVVESLALAQTAPVWEKMAVEQAQKVRELEAQIAALTGQSASRATSPGTGDATRIKTDPHEDPFARKSSDIVLGSRAPAVRVG